MKCTLDDLGYGDIKAYGAEQIPTPNLDRMAENGMIFTDAHSSSATCTPSRFSLLTGTYAFRKNVRILPGNAAMLIDPKMATLPRMLKKAGYSTGVVGKWHLGLGEGNIDWNKRVSPGPKEIGFDYSFLIPATGDRVPTVFLENQEVLNLERNDPIQVNYKKNPGKSPTGKSHPDLLRQGADTQHSGSIVNGISRIGYMSGGSKATWVDEEIPQLLINKSKSFINKNNKKPFFLYLAYHDIHVPRLPHPRFRGATHLGVRGDAIVQMDWCTGEILRILESQGLDKETLIIFTSDNGPILYDGYEDRSVDLNGNHQAAGPFKGGKYSAFEGATRVPTISYWPGTISKGISDALWSHIDLFRSLASLVDIEVTEKEAIDSKNMMDVILGNSLTGRTYLLEESFTLGLRKHGWKYIKPSKKGTPAGLIKKNVDGGGAREPQLYNLSLDRQETKNLASQYPLILTELQDKLNEIMAKEEFE